MTDLLISRDLSPVKRRAKLKALFFEMSRAGALDDKLRAVIDDFDAGVLSGEHWEGNGLVVVGESNSGKTREINRALKRFAAHTNRLECGRDVKFLQIALDGETTWKALGLAVVRELGYDMTARKTEHEIWSQSRRQLERTGTWLIHIDECQHMFETLGEKETRKVINSIKTFMKHRHWPVVVVLSGIDDLLDKVNLDPQFRNLMTAFHMGTINPLLDTDLHEVDTAFVGYAAAVGINIEQVRTEDTYRRLCFGHGNLFGRVFKFMVDLFANAPPECSVMTIEMMAGRYGARTGCMPGHNPFLRDDYHACDVEHLLAGVD
jgi:hypothetical protein